MAAIPVGLPKSTTLQGLLAEALQSMDAAQKTAIISDPNLARVIDSLEISISEGTLTFSGVIPITSAITSAGKLEITAVSKF